MASFGRISKFDPAVYKEHLEQYLDITKADMNRAILLSSVGATTTLTTPDVPLSKAYKELLKLIQKHYKPKPSIIVKRFKFNSHNRQTGETIADVAALRQQHFQPRFSVNFFQRKQHVNSTTRFQTKKSLNSTPKLKKKAFRVINVGVLMK